MPAKRFSPAFAGAVWVDHKDLILPKTSDDRCPAYVVGVIPKLSRLNLLLLSLLLFLCRFVVVAGFEAVVVTVARPVVADDVDDDNDDGINNDAKPFSKW